MSECTPATTYALVVGIEQYEASNIDNLNGQAIDACKFVNWLRANGVPDSHILLFLSPVAENKAVLNEVGLTAQPATQALIRDALTRTLPNVQGNLLFVFWAGHGVIRADGTRQLFYSDGTDKDLRSVDLKALLTALHSDVYLSLKHQIYIIDACANYVELLNLPASVPPQVIPQGQPLVEHKQFVLLGAREGERAKSSADRKTGWFAEAVLERLPAANTGPWPPNMKSIADQLELHFETLRAAGKVKQTPAFFSYRDWDSSERAFGQIASGSPPVTLIDKVIFNLNGEGRQTTPLKLNWPQIRARAIDQAQIAASKSELVYLPRKALEETFARFLRSDSIGFVLIGTYGSGKTCFLRALVANYTNRNNFCTLFYTGEQLRATISSAHSTTLLDIIARDLAPRPLPDSRAVADFWRKLGTLLQDEQRCILIFIDCIDWRGGDRNLLAQIDRDLINDIDVSVYPKLKFVLTCMPENWERLKSQVQLTRGKYYTENVPSGPSPAADALTYSRYLLPFDMEELQLAYTQYRIINPIMPDYSHLEQSHRTRLSHPRTLMHLALNDTQVIGPLWTYCRAFVDDCLRNGVIEPEDLSFLENDLLPLMIRQDRIIQSISDEDLYRGLNGKRRANHPADGRSDTPLVRCLNSGIMERYGQLSRRGVRFTTDEWFIYFAGQHIRQQAAVQTNNGSAEVFINRLRQKAAFPIVRNVILVALTVMFVAGEHEQIAVLCQAEDYAFRELLREAAVTYGKYKSDEARLLFLTLLRTAADAHHNSLFARLPFSRIRVGSPIRSFIVDVARTLGMTDIIQQSERN